MNHYPFNPSDYMMATAHLEPLHDLCYRRCLDLYYDTEKPLANAKQTLSKRLRVNEDVLSDILAEFFFEEEDGWHHKRCDIEIARYQAKSDSAKKAGSLGGMAKKQASKANAKQSLSERLANASNQNQNQNHINPIPQKPLATPSLELLIPETTPNQDLAKIEVGSWFNRRATTAWSEKENKAWRKIEKPINADDWEALKWFYTESGCRFLRRDLQALLNNWTGEIDRAKNYNPEHP